MLYITIINNYISNHFSPPSYRVLLVLQVKCWRRCAQQPRGSGVVVEVGHEALHVQEEEKEHLLAGPEMLQKSNELET